MHDFYDISGKYNKKRVIHYVFGSTCQSYQH